MRDKTTLVIIIAIVVIAVGAIIYALIGDSAEKFAGTLQVEPSSYDWGEIKAVDGLAKAKFTLKNSGSENLKIENITTSCGCTTAKVIKDGQESPEFGMPGHGLQPKFWSLILKPGETAELEAIFDPNFHKNTQGKVHRTIYLKTSDKNNSETSIELYANVL